MESTSTPNINIVYPSPILREARQSNNNDNEDNNRPTEPQTPPKRVQFNENSFSPSRPVSQPSSLTSPLSRASSSPSSSPKKKKKYFYERDSLNSRYKKGAPGSRRHQRWSNEMYLNHDWSDLSESEPEDDDLYEANEETLSRPNFSFVEVYERDTEVLEDFWYGKAASLDSSHCRPVERALPPRRISLEPQDRFLRIPKRTRKSIQSVCDSLLLEELEKDMVSYLSFLHNNRWAATQNRYFDEEDEDDKFTAATTGTTRPSSPTHKFSSQSETFECYERNNQLILYLKDSHARLIAHGVCRYYSLKSESWDDHSNSKRATTVFLPKSSTLVPEAPSLSIKDYLESAGEC
mmetsp:Transcript_23600/g.36808  ORF Transcript_23600/g.36808 Transcript_23600/m.36808 type:complete len:350 (-) Transcript_23600:165-1214(-)|eukprot:CAMPEP_0201524560 /NCGR_PEP_ID=MMETSP0161_2-20130828/23387_1 /ASSEMBLY_ACC=CAM_ASM_000251 /TAXON_ID=180227 /ORGANISM="Neoparamoeba aestuarina, Strain SoJaBio B1-5/56/2" /LENGTH=349 /DNA_ID=CAMNT_0047924025 /DNA_START=115 /DNA_END=1164 /DNA_ORIENTATION=-